MQLFHMRGREVQAHECLPGSTREGARVQGLSRGAAPGGGWYPRRPQGLSILVSSSNSIAHKAQDPAGTGRHGVSVTARVLSRNARVPSGGAAQQQTRDGETHPRLTRSRGWRRVTL
eukprot:COSAG03_NODE_894_length_5464_cov_8.128984_7_plen_117_part_00